MTKDATLSDGMRFWKAGWLLNATVMSWRGVEGGLNAAKAGHNAIMTPMPYAYLDFYQEDPAIAPTTIGGYTTLKKTYSYNPAPMMRTNW